MRGRYLLNGEILKLDHDGGYATSECITDQPGVLYTIAALAGRDKL